MCIRDRSYSYTTTIVGPLAAEGDQTAMGFAGDINPFFQQIEKDRIIKEATEAALAQLGAGFVKTGKYPVVFKMCIRDSFNDDWLF